MNFKHFEISKRIYKIYLYILCIIYGICLKLYNINNILYKKHTDSSFLLFLKCYSCQYLTFYPMMGRI